MTENNTAVHYVANAKEDAENPTSETKFYLDMFHAYKDKPRFATWCWPAYIFGPLWLFYRKMYLFGVLFSALNIMQLIMSKMESTNLVGVGILQVLIGIFGISMYRYDVEKRIKSNKGGMYRGTSVLAPLLVMAIMISGAIFIQNITGIEIFQIENAK
ncbi:MAG: DUF2628 domain-containing protein [Alphaproteobacteria bacterium]